MHHMQCVLVFRVMPGELRKLNSAVCLRHLNRPTTLQFVHGNLIINIHDRRGIMTMKPLFPKARSLPQFQTIG